MKIDTKSVIETIRTRLNTLTKSLKKFIKYRAHVLNDNNGALIIGQTGTTKELDLLEGDLKKKFSIIEVVRSGKLVMAKGKEPT